MHFISRDAEGTSPQTPLSTCSQDQTHPWGRPTKVLQVSRQGAEGCPYLCHERAVPLWASPAALDTTRSVEREMDACSHEGVNLWLPTTSTPLVTSDLIENPGEGWRVGPRGRVLQEVEKTEHISESAAAKLRDLPRREGFGTATHALGDLLCFD